ncbi:MAG: class I SAM-dependent methyltransferase [Nevskia sp.]|nr:class I SAM-dependent methyltransferase [Nevskia sp.]
MSEPFAEHDIEWTPEQVARLWAYYRRQRPFGAQYFAEAAGGRVLAQCGVDDGPQRVLDFGCGVGGLIAHIARQRPRWRYWGVDFSAESVERAREAGRAFAGTQAIECLRGLPMDLPPQSFDLLFLIEVVEHLDDTQLAQSLAEAARLLRPGGRLCITTPNAERLDDSRVFCPECGARFHLWQHLRAWNAASLRAFVEPFGFTLHKSVETSLSANGVVRRLSHWARRRLTGEPQPNLLAVFERS